MYAFVQPCTTKSIANIIKPIYHALTLANAADVKMKVKVKILNFTKRMNTIL